MNAMREMSLHELIQSLPPNHRARLEYESLHRKWSILDEQHTRVSRLAVETERSLHLIRRDGGRALSHQEHMGAFAEAESNGAGGVPGFPMPPGGLVGALPDRDVDMIGDANRDARARQASGGPVRSQPMTAGPAGDPDALRKY